MEYLKTGRRSDLVLPFHLTHTPIPPHPTTQRDPWLLHNPPRYLISSEIAACYDDWAGTATNPSPSRLQARTRFPRCTTCLLSGTSWDRGRGAGAGGKRAKVTGEGKAGGGSGSEARHGRHVRASPSVGGRLRLLVPATARRLFSNSHH